MRRIFFFLVLGCIPPSATNALATDVSDGTNALAPAEESRDEGRPRFFVETSGGAASRRETMAYGTITFAPFGSLNQSGVRLRMEGQNLIYRFKQQDGPKNASASGDQAREWGAGAFIGYEYVAEKFDMAGFVGVNYQRAILPKWVPDNSDSRTGIELSTEIDYHPIEPLSFCLNGSYSTASNFFWVQARPGLAALANVFVGPEFAYQSSKFIRQWRVGTHLGPIELGALAVTVAGGFSRDRAVRSGAYGAIETSFRF